MCEIGGYFELELQRHHEFHTGVMQLNSGRNCFKFILLNRHYRRIYIPSYCCGALLKTISQTGTDYLLYQINEHFEPILNVPLSNDEALLYINYFGICDAVVNKLAKKFSNLIIDNSQAFFSTAILGCDTFYSPRKFFGVPDGGYLYTNLVPPKNLKQDCSYGRFRHLLLRIDKNAPAGYNAFQRNERRIDILLLRSMSPLTQRLLCSIDYEWVKQVRINNFSYIHKALGIFNNLSIDISQLSGPLVYPQSPLVYPFLNKKVAKKYLIDNKIYVPIFWPELQHTFSKKSFEYVLSHDVIYLPVDQRYNENDMEFIIKKIKGVL